MTTAEIIVLGCGDSAGVPKTGNAWGKCDPNEPRNLRTRPAIAVKTATTTLIVDTGPDFRQQMNRENLNDITAVLYTHAHGDHVNGLDDVKPVFERKGKKPVPAYMLQETFDELKYRFHYALEQKHELYPPIMTPHIWTEVDFYQEKILGDVRFTVFEQDHGHGRTLGFRFGDIAYSTDLIRLPEKSFGALQGIKTWIVDGANLYFKNAIVHMTLDHILEYNARIGAEQIYLTHLKNDLDYQTLMNDLPKGIEPAYDGLRLKVDL